MSDGHGGGGAGGSPCVSCLIKIWSRSILGVNRAELVRILELGIRSGAFAISRMMMMITDDDDDYIYSFYGLALS